MFIKFPDSYRLKPELKIVTAKTNAAKVNNTKIEKLLAEKTVITSIGNFTMKKVGRTVKNKTFKTPLNAV